MLLPSNAWARASGSRTDGRRWSAYGATIAERRAGEHERVAERERFQRLTIACELKMIELKKQIEELTTRELGAIEVSWPTNPRGNGVGTEGHAARRTREDR